MSKIICRTRAVTMPVMWSSFAHSHKRKAVTCCRSIGMLRFKLGERRHKEKDIRRNNEEDIRHKIKMEITSCRFKIMSRI